MTRGAEDRLIAWLRERSGSTLLGDDAAVILPVVGDASEGPDRAAGDGPLVVTTDSQIGGVHVPRDLDPGILARRLLHVNLSDLAAMGFACGAPTDGGGSSAPPIFALVALAAPEVFDRRHFFAVLLDECAQAGVTLAGGDLAAGPCAEGEQVAAATMTLLARPAPGWRPVTRGAARPGDGLWVGGSLGEAAAGLRLLGRGGRQTAPGEHAHVFLPEELRSDAGFAEVARRAIRRNLEPTAQMSLGGWLSSAPPRAAALDLSDGLARDLPRLARESGVGAVVDAPSLPVAERFDLLCAALGEDPVELAVAGGEDFVLLFALPEGTEPPGRFRCARIGRVTAGEELTLRRDGVESEWPYELGWDHLERG